jgi:hypothetical protein
LFNSPSEPGSCHLCIGCSDSQVEDHNTQHHSRFSLVGIEPDGAGSVQALRARDQALKHLTPVNNLHVTFASVFHFQQRFDLLKSLPDKALRDWHNACPFGVGSTRLLIDSILDLGINAISCTPSYPGLIEQVLRELDGIRPRDLKLRLGLFGGEAGLDNPDLRAAMEDKWGFKVRNANFGLSEVLSILGGQTDWTNDLLFHASDVVFAEIIDPATLLRLPIVEGAVGELVCTHCT